MSSKVLLVKYLPHFPRSPVSVRNGESRTKTAIVLSKTADNCISIQGYPPVPCKEKLKCWSLFQQAVKHLLAVPDSTSVCVCFAEAPHTVISSLSTLLQQPSHVLDLIVSPLPATTTSSHSTQDFPIEEQDFSFKDTRDPYCRYREMYRTYCHSGRAGESTGPVRQRCNFAEMNRLVSQLTEVSLCLQRTQDECERIAKKCGPSKSSTTQGDTTPKSTQSQSDSDIDSGKGSSPPVSSDIATSTEEEREGEEGTDDNDGVRSMQSAQESVADKEVESLIGVAKSLVEHYGRKKGHTDVATRGGTQLSFSTSQVAAAAVTSSNSKSSSQLPDCPSEVSARPSFTPGGAYVMWNPVSLDAHDRNNGHQILGYQVFVDGELAAAVEGPLASQVELTDMKHNTTYQVQVCAHSEHTNSSLSPLLTYTHIEPKQLTQNKPKVSPRPVNPRDSKAAQVESWLKNGRMSETPHDSTDLPVHLTKDTVCTSTCPTHRNLTPLTTADHDTHYCSHDMTLVDSCEDTKSIGSSHTSGIVTDYPVSPKLHPACECSNCSSKLMESFSCTHHDSGTVVTTGHYGNANTLSTPSSRLRHTYLKDSLLNSNTSASSTLCPTPLSSTVDTVIDEPLNLEQISKTDQVAGQRLFPSHACVGLSGPATAYSSHLAATTYTTTVDSKNHKGPASPQNVLVTAGSTPATLTVSWTPVGRDLKGCSNGCYVLGYRIFVNGSLRQSVDGAVTSTAIVRRPTNSNLPYHRHLIHVTTRSIAGESIPSNGVIYDSMLQREYTTTNPPPRSNKLDSVISSTVDSTSVCTKSESVVSHSTTAATIASHPMAKRYRLESYV